jgi:8-oxo-dGTP diphosphatase
MEEETGLQIKIQRKVAEYIPCNQLAELTDFYECDIIRGNLKTGAETREIDFFPIAQLPKTFFMIHHDWLQDALINSPEVIHKHLTQITYINLFKYLCKHPGQVLRFLLSRLGFPLNR